VTAAALETLDGFVLTRSQRDAHGGVALEYWLSTPRGPLRARVFRQRGVFFVPEALTTRGGERKAVALTTPDGEPVHAVYFGSLRELRAERDQLERAGTPALEADVLASARYLMERFITSACSVRGALQRRSGFADVSQPELRAGQYAPQLTAASIDIETDGFDADSGNVLSIAVVCGERERVFMLGDAPGDAQTVPCSSERELLERFCAYIRELDPDLLLGWNVVEFDLDYLSRRAGRLGAELALGRDGSALKLLEGQSLRARIAGRVVLDGIGSLRAASHVLESWALHDVAEKFLGRGKLISAPGKGRVAEIVRLWQRDRPALAAYNLEDCRLVRDIFAKTDLIDFLIERARLTGLPLDRSRGAVAAFDYLYLPRLHRAGFVAPSVSATAEITPSPGGYVLDSTPGLFGDVIVLDFKSLYPSIIRTFHIDPLALWVAGDDAIPGFAGARFDRRRHILPQLITQLWSSRDEAKRKHDSARSYAIKILMNSFYGVLGTPACRFFNPALANAITGTGKEMLLWSKRWFEDAGFRVIYGDTDSLFVESGSDDPEAARQRGQELAKALTAQLARYIEQRWGVQSRLHLKFEKLYLRLFLPTARNSTRGASKRYAGLRQGKDENTVEFVGMEVVRSDWTALAKDVQRELYQRLFTDQPVDAYLLDVVKRVRSGALDDSLVYRKNLRKRTQEYTATTPPHVAAARKSTQPPGRSISYVMTTAGPEPTDNVQHPLDREHYVEKQVKPVAEPVLDTLGLDFELTVGDQGQLRMF
jgi:DNA polymerase-2